MVLVLLADQNALADKPGEPGSQDLAGDPQVLDEVVEPGHAQEHIAHDQRHPRVAEQIRGAGDRAGHIGKTSSVHERTLPESPQETWPAMVSLRDLTEGSP